MSGPVPTSPAVPRAVTIALSGAMVTAGQTFVLVAYLVLVVVSFGLALFIFFVPLFVWLVIPWMGGDRLLPAPSQGRRWAVVPLSVPISIAATWLAVLWTLSIMGTDHDWGWAYLVDLVLVVAFSGAIGAACWSLIGLLVRRLLIH